MKKYKHNNMLAGNKNKSLLIEMGVLIPYVPMHANAVTEHPSYVLYLRPPGKKLKKQKKEVRLWPIRQIKTMSF